MINIKYYNDPELSGPHIQKHDISEAAIVDFFNEIDYFEHGRKDGSFEAMGRISNGRYLIVSYRKEDEKTIFVITAYDIEDKELINNLDEYYENY